MKLLSQLRETSKVISECQHLKEDLVDSQLKLRKELRQREILLKQQTSEASKNVKQKLRDLHEDVDQKLSSTPTLVEQLDRKLTRLSSAADSGLNMTDRELHEMLSLLKADVQQLTDLPPVSELVTVHSTLPLSCKEVIQKWFLLPSLSEGITSKLSGSLHLH